MFSLLKAQRYAAVAQRELGGQSLRQPVWNEALAEAKGDEAAARENYVQRRVAQMLADEVAFQTARREFRETQAFYDSLALRTFSKNGLLGAGIALSLLLAYLLMK